MGRVKKGSLPAPKAAPSAGQLRDKCGITAGSVRDNSPLPALPMDCGQKVRLLMIF